MSGLAEQATDVLRAALATYGHWREVTGIDLGPKYRAGKCVEPESIRLHVAIKKDPGALKPAEIFPTRIMGMHVDVLERAYVPAVEGRTGISTVAATPGAGRFSTLSPGISVSHKLCPSGTLGLLVTDNADGGLALLTNWHILADSPFAVEGDPITQPSSMDGGKQPQDTVAFLGRSMLDQDGDAALARLSGSRATDLMIRDLGVVARRVADPVIGEILVKCGRSTNITHGRVEGRGVYFPIYRTKDRIGIEGFEIVPIDRGNPTNVELSTNGDSGAVWLRDDASVNGTVVGLHFAGERDAAPEKEAAIVCFATRVFRRLNISLP
jgi:hypothetical protein